MAKTPPGTYMVAKQDFMVGEGTQIRKGEIFNADDPVIQGREALFEDFAVRIRDTRKR